MNDALDFGSLRSLRLSGCSGWQLLLDLLVERGEPIRLKSLELQWSKREATEGPYASIGSFLRAFRGLEELFVDGDDPEDSTGDIWEAALCHRDTLRRLVTHRRTVNRWIGEDDEMYTQLFGSLVDAEDMEFEDPGRAADELGGVLWAMDLISLGLSCHPRYMRGFIDGFARKECLEVLHVRQSGLDLENYPNWALASEDSDESSDEDNQDECGDAHPPDPTPIDVDPPEGEGCSGLRPSFVAFAQWAFGPAGIRSLRLLAVGDFTCDGRFKDGSLLLCRRDPPPPRDGGAYFRRVDEEGDARLWELYEREKHVLAV